MKLSVIICTHNPREEFLRRTLEALQNQTLPLENWELLLIDNASPAPLATRWDLSWHPDGRHTREEQLGLTAARLRGIRESTAELLVFVDDDTVLAADYLAQALNISGQWPFIGMWGGSCLPEYEVPLPAWVGENVWRLLCVEVKADVWSNLRESFTTMPAGAGMCVRRNVCERFLQECLSKQNLLKLGRKGTSLAGYEDAEIAHCALDLGLGTGKSVRLRLTHLVPASRLTIDYFVRHAEGDAASWVLFRASRGIPITPPRPVTLLNSLRWFIHRLVHHVPREQYLIQKAHQRGLEKGWAMAQAQTGQTNTP